MKSQTNEISNTKPTWHHKHADTLSAGERFAGRVARIIGSWRFIVTLTIIVVLWMGLNVIAYIEHWDPYPFVLLNLIFSTQAAYSAPIIMMAQNRQSERDRHQALADYETNLEAKKEIERLQLEIERIKNEKLDKILEILNSTKK